MSTALLAEGVGQLAVMDEGQALGGPGEGHVERAQALGLLVDDGGRLDHDAGIELEALHQADGHHRDLLVEAVAGGLAVVDAGIVERRADPLDQRLAGR